MGPSFPDAATTSDPARTAAETAWRIKGSGSGAAEAEVDHTGTLTGRSEDPRHDVARLEPYALAERRVPRAQHRLRIDPRDADPVDRGADDRSDGGAVTAADRCWLLRVESEQIGAAGELGMRDVDAGVDDRDRDARPGRLQPVDSDHVAPPLLRHQRLGAGLGDRQRAGLAVEAGLADGAEGPQAREDARRVGGGKAIEAKLGRDLACGTLLEQANRAPPGVRSKLDQRVGSARRGRNGKRGDRGCGCSQPDGEGCADDHLVPDYARKSVRDLRGRFTCR